MMSSRFVLRPDRLRRVPSRFSWLDQRLVREGRLRDLSHAAGMLYLFLVTVSDSNGMSWYSQRRIGLELGMSGEAQQRARTELEQAGLVAYGEPFYQVLELGAPAAPVARVPGPGQRERQRPQQRAATAAEVHAMLTNAFGPRA